MLPNMNNITQLSLPPNKAESTINQAQGQENPTRIEDFLLKSTTKCTGLPTSKTKITTQALYQTKENTQT